MGRLQEFAKQPKRETKSYQWKVDAETYERFKAYCHELNFSINEALTKLVELELEDYKPKRKKRVSAKAKPKRKNEKKKKDETEDGERESSKKEVR